MSNVEVIRMTYEEFLAKGEQLFGEDYFQWKFKCPACGHVQSVEDFRKYKDQGATPESAWQQCIGRYEGGNWIGQGKPTSPCDYAGYGLLRLSPYYIEMPDGKVILSFAFAEE